jgi:fucose permease
VAYFSFVVSGFTDAAYGPLIPSLEVYYSLSYTPVSVVFLTPLAGYMTACALNHYLARALGRRGPATLGPLARMAMFVVVATRPPFPAVAAITALAGFTCGYQDGTWNSWLGGAGNFENPSVLLGGLHACYGVGALLSPLVSTLMLQRGWGWWCYFYFMIALEAVEMVLAAPAFWAENGRAYREEQRAKEAAEEGGGAGEDKEDKEAAGAVVLGEGDGSGGDNGATAAAKTTTPTATKTTTPTATTTTTTTTTTPPPGNPLREAALTMPTARVCWTTGVFLLAYTGIEVGYGGWTTTFMQTVRGATPFAAGMATTGYWIGITVGRLTLGFFNAWIGERVALFVGGSLSFPPSFSLSVPC